MTEDEYVMLESPDRLPFEMPQNPRELKDLLTQYGVWSEAWSDQKVMELYDEVRFGEKRLVEYFDPEDTERTNPHLGAEMDIISVDVRTHVGGEEKVLVEVWQTSIYIQKDADSEEDIPKDITVKERVRNLPRSLSEKMKPDEEVLEAAIRAMKEELAIYYEVDYSMVQSDVLEEEKISKGFPGLKTFTTVNVFNAEVSKSGHRENYFELEALPSEPGIDASKVTKRTWAKVKDI